MIYQNLRRVGSNSSDTGTVVPAGAQVGLRGADRGDLPDQRGRGTCSRRATASTWRSKGNGYFQITLPTGDTAYTRDGTFSLSPAGQIVTAEGYTVAPGITVPTNATDVTINSSGEVQVKIEGTTAPQTVGTVQLATFPNEAGLEARGNNLLLASAASGNAVTGNPSAPGFGSVLQGFVESSNVNVVTEITNLITAQRAYEMNSRVITTSDQMQSTLTNLR